MRYVVAVVRQYDSEPSEGSAEDHRRLKHIRSLVCDGCWAQTLRQPLLQTSRRGERHDSTIFVLPYLRRWYFRRWAFYAALGNSQQRESSTRDAVEEAQTPRQVPSKRPEQQKSTHDQSDIFGGASALPSSPIFQNQPDQGRMLGFNLARDPLKAKQPMQPAEEIQKNDIADKPKVMAAQQKLLEQRNLAPKLDPDIKMTRGKPLAVGPTVRLPNGLSWQSLAQMAPGELRKRGVFPYPSLPHPKHAAGGMVFPDAQLEMFPRLERFDVAFDIPEAFLPEFPPAIFLQNRPELGDASRGDSSASNVQGSHKTFPKLTTKSLASTNSVSLRFWN